MQMIKKDVGLFNIFFNSSLYREYLSKLEITDSKVKLDDVQALFGLTDPDKRNKAVKLLTSENYLDKYISRELQELNQEAESAHK